MPTPTDAALLLQACREQPEENVPRLMLADAIQDEYDGAAAYIRDDIAHWLAGRPKGKRLRHTIARNYCRWLESLYGLPPATETHQTGGISGSDGWEGFHWRVGDGRDCDLYVQRGLPMRLKTTCPMLMERSKEMFLFPLTEVSVTDRKPERDDVIPPIEYLWVGTLWPQTWNTWEQTPHELPSPLYQMLPLEALPMGRNLSRGRYTKSSRAHAALNAAALAFGRAATARTSCAAQSSV